MIVGVEKKKLSYEVLPKVEQVKHYSVKEGFGIVLSS